LSSDLSEIPLLSIRLEPSPSTVLSQPSSIMVDKVTTVPRSQLDEHIGGVPDTDMLAISRALVVFLGIAG
jgi:mRNA interferase MazF